MRNIHTVIIVFILSLTPLTAIANWAGNITVANNYLFNGISQTDDKAALQAEATWSAANGLYVGSWLSNVDYSEQANLEVDLYFGYSHAFNQQHTVDTGMSLYTYHGSSYSDDINFYEFYVTYNIINTSFSFWFTPDYFGSSASHYIVKASHTFILTEYFSLLLSLDKSTSLDSDKWQWQTNDNNYIHGQITALTSYQHFDLSFGLHGTDLDNENDIKFLFTLSYNFT